MTKEVLILMLLILFTASCGNGTKKQERARKPSTVEEYTQAIVKEVQQVILSTDQQLREEPPSSTELASEDGPIRLQLWMESDKPVKIAANEPGEAGLTEYYFANDDLFFATRPGAKFIFIERELKYWLDEKWQPREIPRQQWEMRETYLLREAERYLEAFGI